MTLSEHNVSAALSGGSGYQLAFSADGQRLQLAVGSRDSQRSQGPSPGILDLINVDASPPPPTPSREADRK